MNSKSVICRIKICNLPIKGKKWLNDDIKAIEATLHKEVKQKL